MIIKSMHRPKQWIMSRATGVISREPEVIKGSGALLSIPARLAAGRNDSAMVATTSGFIRRGTLKPFLETLEAEGIRVTLFSEVVPDPTIECVEKMVTEYVLGGCNAVVAIGGGSVIDCAKAAAARIARPEKKIRDMKGLLKIRAELPEFYAVPTTAGTGSEATAAAVVTDTVDGRHYKYSLNDTCLIPGHAVLDPELGADLPAHITAETGMDALTHAVEAYTNRYPSRLAKDKALNAVRLIYENLPSAFALERGAADEGSLEIRENMLVASYDAGVAFTNNFVGYVHAVAHGIGALYGMAHGRANAIILPHVLQQFGKAAEKPLAQLGRAVGLKGEGDDILAAEFIESIRKMNESFGIPDRIEELKEADFDILIERAIAEANYTYPVPDIWSEDDFRTLLQKLMART